MVEKKENMDWDSEIENDGQAGKTYSILPVKDADGKPIPYGFGIKRMTKGTAPKLHCPMAKLDIGIFADSDVEFNQELLEVKDSLCLHTTCEWKISEFFRAICEKKHGQKIKPNWDTVAGATGRCTLIIDVFEKRDGTKGEKNKIAVFLDPVDTEKKPAAEEQKAPEKAPSKFA